MIQFRIWIVHDQISCLSKFHTEINIVKCHLQFFTQTTDFLKRFPFYHHTSRSHRTVILCTNNPVAVPGKSTLLLYKTVSGDSTETDDHAGMLDRIIFVIQSRTHSTHIFSGTVTKQFLQTIVVDDLGIVF